MQILLKLVWIGWVKGAAASGALEDVLESGVNPGVEWSKGAETTPKSWGSHWVSSVVSMKKHTQSHDRW